MLNRSTIGLYLLPPRRRFRWEAFHTIIILALLVHIGIFVLIGQIIPSIPKSKVAVFDVDLIKKMKTKVINAPMMENEVNANQGSGIKDKESAPPNKSKKDPGPIKPRPPEKEVPKLEKRGTAAPNKPIKINLPKPDYKRVDPYAAHKVFKQPENAHEKGAPSGTKDGILESKGVDGTEKGEGSIPKEGGGQGGGDGNGNGLGGGGGFRPYVYWEYNGFKPGALARTPEEKKARYFEMSDTPPYLADAIVPEPHRLVGLGHGKVLFEVIIPGVEEVPSNGVHPESIKILGVDSVIPESAEKMKEMAMLSVKSSGWYPGKRGGAPVREKIEFALVFFGSYEEK